MLKLQKKYCRFYFANVYYLNRAALAIQHAFFRFKSSKKVQHVFASKKTSGVIRNIFDTKRESSAQLHEIIEQSE